MLADASPLSWNTKTLLNILIGLYLCVIGGGMYETFTHRISPVFTNASDFAYGMLAPYQNDQETSIELAVVAEQPNGLFEPLPIDRYFVGGLAERDARSILTELRDQDSGSLLTYFVPMMTQILQHERESGRDLVSLRVYREEWLRSAEGYDYNRIRSSRTFITSVR